MAVIVPGVWVLLMSTKIGFFGRWLFFVGAMLGFTVDTCSASVLWLWTYFTHFFYDAADSNPDAFLLHSVWMEKCAQSMLLVSVCSARFTFGNLEVLFSSFSWLRCVIRDHFFGAPVLVTGAGGAGVAGSCTPMWLGTGCAQLKPGVCGQTHLVWGKAQKQQQQSVWLKHAFPCLCDRDDSKPSGWLLCWSRPCFWLRTAEEGAPAPLVAATRADDRAHGVGTPWNRLSTPRSSCHRSMFLCRRWRTNCWRYADSSILLFPSRLSKCPRSPLSVSLSGAVCVLRSRWQNSWWKYRRSYRTHRYAGLWSRTWIFQFVVVVVASVSVYTQDRVQQRKVEQISCQQRLPSKTLTFQFLVVAEIFFLQRLPPVCRVRQIKGFFALFPEGQKVRGRVRTRGRNWVRASAHPRRRLSWHRRFFKRASGRTMLVVCGCSFPVVGGNFWAWTQKSGGLGEGWVVLVQFALGICYFISVSLYLALIVPGVWVLLLVAKIGFFGRCLLSWWQCLVQQWIHALRQYFESFGRIYTADLISKRCFSVRFEWRSVPSRCFDCSLALRGSHFASLEVLFTSFTGWVAWSGTGFFGAPVSVTGAGVARSLLPGGSEPGLPIRSFSCVDIGIAGSSICVKNNNNNNNNNTIWWGSVLTGEEPPPHSGELKHALTPSRRPSPIPAFPPHVVRTPHLHGAPTTEETGKLWY